LLAMLTLAASLQEQALPVPPLSPLEPNVLAALPPPEIPLDTSYLTLTKKAQLWGIFTPEVRAKFLIADLAALKKAWASHELVDVAEVNVACSFTLRKTGKWPIAEKDLPNRDYYYGLRPPAIGLLLRVCEHMQGVQAPMELTSLVRTWKYQLKLARGNPTANVLKMNVPPTHVFGLAFDIARINLSASQQKFLEDYLVALTNQGLIIYFKETSPQYAFHVIALPAAHPALIAYYESARQQIAAGLPPGSK
jgi:hypothetical protein